jgi:hypothetical protein
MSSSDTSISTTSILDEIPIDLFHDIFAYMEQDQDEIKSLLKPLSERMKELVTAGFFNKWMCAMNKCSSCVVRNHDNILELMDDDSHDTSIKIHMDYIKCQRNHEKMLQIMTKLRRNTTIHTLSLHNGNFKENQARRLVDVLQRNTTLHTLNFGSEAYTDLTATAIAELLENNTTITSLRMGAYVNGIHRLAQMLRRNTTLRNLHMNATCHELDCRTALLESVVHHPAITTLKIVMDFTDSLAGIMGELISTTRTLQSLTITGMTEKTHIQQIAAPLSRNSTILKLDLNDCHFNNDIIEVIADALKMNTTLQDIYFPMGSVNSISEPVIGDLFLHNRSLSRLSIYDGTLFSKSVENICRGWTHNIFIRELIFENIYMLKTAANQFADFIRTNTTIRKLCMSSIKYDWIGDNAFINLIEAFKVNCGIVDLDLRSCHIIENDHYAENICFNFGDSDYNYNTDVINRLSEIVATNTTIQKLNFSYCSFNHKIGGIMGEALRRNSTLTDLNITTYYDNDNIFSDIFDGLMENHSIQKLQMSTTVNHDKFANFIARNTTIKTFILQLNIFDSDDYMGPLTDAFIENRGIRHLIIGSSNLKKRGMQDLLRIARNNPRIKITNHRKIYDIYLDAHRELETLMLRR